MTAKQIRSCWKRIDVWLDYRVPRMWLESPGLSESEIRDAEETFGHRLPMGVRESYRIHNGLIGVEIVPNSHNIGFFLPLTPPKKTWPGVAGRSSIDTWKQWNKVIASGEMENSASPRGPIEKVYWSRNWLPIFDNIQGDYLLLDMKPVKGGLKGQVIEFLRLDGPNKVYTRNFGDWLGSLADDLEQDRYHLELGSFSATLEKKTAWRRRLREESRLAQTEAESPSRELAESLGAFTDFFNEYFNTPDGRAIAREQKKRRN